MSKKDEKTTSDEIIVNDPMDLRPVALPLVITLPESASAAQIEYAKILNSYAYQNPEKWKQKKDDLVLKDGKVIKGLISKLKDLKDAPPPEKQNLTVGTKNTMGA